VILVCIGLALACGSCGQASQSCVVVPQDFPHNKLVASGATAHAPVGAVLWVELVEPAGYSATSYPKSFPWLTPSSSDQKVLLAVRLCPRRAMYSLPVKITAFRSVGKGNATLRANLAPPWKGRTRALQNYHATVIVRH
jgi:hypothetical protein